MRTLRYGAATWLVAAVVVSAFGVVGQKSNQLEMAAKGKWTVRAAWPDLSKFGALGAYAEADLAKMFKASTSAFEKQAKADFASFAKQKIAMHGSYEYQGQVSIGWADAKLVSVLTTEYSFTGGAHGGVLYGSRLYAAGKGGPSRIETANLFRKGVDGLKLLSQMVYGKLQRNPDALFVQDGTVKSLKPSDVSTLVVRSNGLDVVIAPYTAGPWSSGTIHVLIPYGEISDLLDRSGPLATVLNRLK